MTSVYKMTTYKIDALLPQAPRRERKKEREREIGRQKKMLIVMNSPEKGTDEVKF